MLVLHTTAFSQTKIPTDYELQQQAAYDRMIGMAIDSAVYFIDHGKYSQAEEQLSFILKNSRSVPSDVVFYFGKNSFYLNKYSQSVDWLNKYIQLKGSSGQFYGESIKLLKQAESEILVQNQTAKPVQRDILSRDYDIDCGPAGKVTCPICKGTTVVIKKGYIESTYKTCQYCNEHGQLTCQEYNLLIRGELQPVR
ncbi:MAG: hypothetical protein HC811_09305 [Flammeovirgaceae bacterium]|nr:hypothetical protein [Flammeovirgaceae bacterium]